MIDEFPAFAVAAACAQGDEQRLAGARAAAQRIGPHLGMLGSELRRLGVDFSETADGFVIRGGNALTGGEANPHGDHRLAMALALVGLVSTAPVTVSGAEIIDESFPGFAQTLRALGADVKMDPAADEPDRPG